MSLAVNQATRGYNRMATAACAGREFDAGLLLLDSASRPVYVSPEAIRILLYPQKPENVQSVNYLAQKVHSVCLENGSAYRSSSTSELISGKRRYSCRIFDLGSGWKNSHAPAMVILIER